MATRTPNYYASTDSSAPVLTGQNGSLISLLDAILVNGYGSKAAAGWTKPYSTTNIAVFQMAAGGTNCVLRVLDDGSQTAGAREAVVRAAESASGHSTVTDPFPLVANVADANAIWRKSTTADATARVWKCVADGRFFALWVEHAAAQSELYMFGDIEPVYSGDAYSCFMSTRGNGNASTILLVLSTTASQVGTSVGSFRSAMMRNASGSIKAETAAPLILSSNNFGNAGNTSTVADYPNPATSKLHLSQALVVSQGTSSAVTAADGAMVRGYLPFVFEPLHGLDFTNMSHNDTFTDTAYDASSEFVYLVGNAGSPASGIPKVVLQTAGIWST